MVVGSDESQQQKVEILPVDAELVELFARSKDLLEKANAIVLKMLKTAASRPLAT